MLFHVGNESQLKTAGYGGRPMKVYVHRRQPDQVAAWLRDAGFTVEAHLLLDSDENPAIALLLRAASPRSGVPHAEWGDSAHRATSHHVLRAPTQCAESPDSRDQEARRRRRERSGTDSQVGRLRVSYTVS